MEKRRLERIARLKEREEVGYEETLSVSEHNESIIESENQSSVQINEINEELEMIDREEVEAA